MTRAISKFVEPVSLAWAYRGDVTLIADSSDRRSPSDRSTLTPCAYSRAFVLLLCLMRVGQPTAAEIARINDECRKDLNLFAAIAVPIGTLYGVSMGRALAAGTHGVPAVFATATFVGSVVIALLALLRTPDPGWGITQHEQAAHVRRQAAKVRHKWNLVRIAIGLLLAALIPVGWLAIAVFR